MNVTIGLTARLSPGRAELPIQCRVHVADQLGHLVGRCAASRIIVQGDVEASVREPQFEEVGRVPVVDETVVEHSELVEIGPNNR